MTAKEIPPNKQWANDLKPGDVVFVYGRWNTTLYKTKVQKVTKASIITENGTNYPRATLKHRIDSWRYLYLEQATPETEARHKIQETRLKIHSLAYDIYNTKIKRSTVGVMTIEELLVLQGAMEAVCTLLDEAEKKVKR